MLEPSGRLREGILRPKQGLEALTWSLHVARRLHVKNLCTCLALYQCAAVPVYQCIGVPVYLCTSVLVYQCLCVPVCWCTCVPVHWCAGVPMYQCTSVPVSGVPLYWCTGVPMNWCTGVSVYRRACLFGLPRARLCVQLRMCTGAQLRMCTRRSAHIMHTYFKAIPRTAHRLMSFFVRRHRLKATSGIALRQLNVIMNHVDGPRGSKMAPRWPQEAPRWPHEDFKMPQDGPT